MRLKLDENLPESLAQVLRQLGHDVDTVEQEALTGQSDPVVWRATQNAQRFLITQDLDFADLRQFEPGAHHGIMLVRLHRPGRLALLNRISGVFRSEDAASWSRCFLIVSDLKVRIRRPK